MRANQPTPARPFEGSGDPSDESQVGTLDSIPLINIPNIPLIEKRLRCRRDHAPQGLRSSTEIDGGESGGLKKKIFSNLRLGFRLSRAIALLCCLALLDTGASFIERSSIAEAALPVRDGIPSLAPLLRKTTAAVVNISVRTPAPRRYNPLLRDPFFRHFFDLPQAEPPRLQERAAGSGVIVDADLGLVLTNHHIVERADAVVVILEDKRRFVAQLLGSDPGTDIALLQIDAEGLTSVPVGDSDDLHVGDFVIAIGNPFGLGKTVTSGIVSALGRSGLDFKDFEDFIQTDASINPGNSGGALINLKGELVGINTAILGPSGGNIGIGFAVPSNMASAVMRQLAEYGDMVRGGIGVVVQDLDPDLAEALGVANGRGTVIVEVKADSPAERAGLRIEDVITAIDGSPVDDARDLLNSIGLIRVGEDIDLDLIRAGEPLRLTATIGSDTSPLSHPALQGATIRDIEKDDPKYRGVDGVLIARVERDSVAAWNGIRPGDIILAINNRRVRNSEDMQSVLRPNPRNLTIRLLRGNRQLLLVLQ
ncbi:Do family serine endopeptidase [Thioalkalivibrio sp. HK1]|uniref:Do family serine endopeptidase n=1 Tax=Thioalkalivibrio sp. HK1 TaxID=1469245 RepID=UPI00046EC2C3|nr:Do family serine endopeptidase [Thioalkalivibrio sp. HK1]